MKNCKSKLCAMGLVLAFMTAALAADKPNLTFKITRINPPEALQILVKGVNNAGVKVGRYQDTDTSFHGFMLKVNKFTDIDHPDAADTTNCRSINYNGAAAIVGDYVNSNGSGVNVGFLFKNGKFTDIPGPSGAVAAVASGINDNGDIVGTYQDASFVDHGFLLKGTKYTTLDVPGSTSTDAEAIDNKGNILLFSQSTSCPGCAWLFNGTTYKKINVPGAAASFPEGLSNYGDIVYEWLDSSYTVHGALRHAGKYYKFKFPGGVDTSSTGINDRQVIVGTEVARQDRTWRGFKVTYH
jgi:chitinase